jgi:hypothetical protein
MLSGRLYRTSNGGRSWSSYGKGLRTAVGDMAFVSATEGWAIGLANYATPPGSLLHTIDAGLTWTANASWQARSSSSMLQLQGLHIIDRLHLLLTTGVGDGQPPYLLASTDGGATWGAVPVGEARDVAFTDPQHGWVLAGSSGILHASSGGGITPLTLDDAPWASSRSVIVHLQAQDDGRGLGTTTYRVDGGPWQQGMAVSLPAPADHSGDGYHVITFRSTDGAGSTALPVWRQVIIDTQSPATRVFDRTVRRGSTALIRFRVTDNMDNMVRASLVISDGRGRIVRRLGGLGATPNGTQFVAVRDLAAGRYRVVLYATDMAGNRATERIAGTLIVK